MSLENYEPVAVRLARLIDTIRGEGKEPRIITVMLSAPGADVCVFRAELWLGEQLMATGHAEEVRGQGNVNRTSHVENCETSSLGRMCESYFPTPDLVKRPSREEMGKVHGPGGSRPEWKQARTTERIDTQNLKDELSGAGRPALTGGISEKQAGYIKGAAKRDGHPAPFGVDGWTKAEASAWIEAHKNGTNAGDIPNPLHADGEEPF